MMCNICVDIHIHVHLHIHCFRLNANCFSIYIYIYIYIYGLRLCRRRLFLRIGFHDTWYLEWCLKVSRNMKVGGWQLMPVYVFELLFFDFH